MLQPFKGNEPVSAFSLQNEALTNNLPKIWKTQLFAKCSSVDFKKKNHLLFRRKMKIVLLLFIRIFYLSDKKNSHGWCENNWQQMHFS